MITSLQNFFLKHNKWLFGSLLIVIIVTFVLTIGPQSFFGSGGSTRSKELQYYGYDLSSESDQRAMIFTAEVSAILHPELQLRREQLMDYAYMRIAALGIAEQIGVPKPTKDDLAAFVETLMIFSDPATGTFSAESYNRMMEALQSDARFDSESIGLVLREDYRIEQVRKALGGPDYSLPFERKQEFIDRQTSYAVSTATLAYESFSPEVTPSEESLLQFFNENPTRYEIGETLSVSALQFRAASYLGDIAAPTEADLAAYFATNRTRYDAEREQPAEGEPPLPELSLEDVRVKVTADWIQAQATSRAAKKSEEFSLRLWREGIALDSPEYTALIEEFAVTTKDIPPYSRGENVQTADAPADLLDSMWIFASNPNRYFSDIAQMPDGAVVLVKRGLTSARMPEFSEVRDQVSADYFASEKRRLFSEKGVELYETIQSRLQSESFADIATSLGLEINELGTFSGSEVPQELLRSTIWDQARFLEKGEISKMVIEGDAGVFAAVLEKTIPEIDEDSEAYKTFVAQRTDFLSETMGWARLREITDKSLSSLLGTNPLDQ